MDTVVIRACLNSRQSTTEAKEGAYLSTPLIDDAAYLLRVPNKTNVHLILSSPDGIGTTKNLKSCSTKPYGRTVRLRITNGVRILGRNLLLKIVDTKAFRPFAESILSHFDKLRACPEFIEGTGRAEGIRETAGLFR